VKIKSFSTAVRLKRLHIKLDRQAERQTAGRRVGQTYRQRYRWMDRRAN